MKRKFKKSEVKVIAELAFYTGIGVGLEAAGAVVSMDCDARDFWLKRHMKAIPKALKIDKGQWRRRRRFVVPVAVELGRCATRLAKKSRPKSQDIRIEEDHVVEASRIISDGDACKAAKGEVRIFGGYCEGSDGGGEPVPGKKR